MVFIPSVVLKRLFVCDFLQFGAQASRGQSFVVISFVWWKKNSLFLIFAKKQQKIMDFLDEVALLRAEQEEVTRLFLFVLKNFFF